MPKRVKISGVGIFKPTGRWRAYTHVGHKMKHLGYFDTQAEAADAKALYEMDHPEAGKQPKAPKVKAKRQEPRAQSQERGAAPAGREDGPSHGLSDEYLETLSDDEFAIVTFDKTKVPGPDNPGRLKPPPEMWGQWTERGLVDQWFNAGERWKFERYYHADDWVDELCRLEELWSCDINDVERLLLEGRRAWFLAHPEDAPKTAKTIDPAVALGVADLV